LLESRPDFARGYFRDVDQHDRVPAIELLYRAIDGIVVERGPAEKLPDPTETGNSSVLPVIWVADDHDALGIREGALAPTVGTVSEAACGEAADVLAAAARDAGVAPDGGVWTDGSGESAYRLAADLLRRAARQESDVAERHPRRPQHPDRSPGGVLAGVCLAECGHEAHLLGIAAWRMRRRICGALAGR
jgi:hypothetical protein